MAEVRFRHFHLNLIRMKSKIIKTVLLVIVLAVLFTAYDMVKYNIETVYAVNAADQLESDSAYYALEAKGKILLVVNFLMTVFVAGLGAAIYKVWNKK